MNDKYCAYNHYGGCRYPTLCQRIHTKQITNRYFKTTKYKIHTYDGVTFKIIDNDLLGMYIQYFSYNEIPKIIDQSVVDTIVNIHHTYLTRTLYTLWTLKQVTIDDIARVITLLLHDIKTKTR